MKIGDIYKSEGGYRIAWGIHLDSPVIDSSPWYETLEAAEQAKSEKLLQEMATVRLHWIETRKDDPFKRDTFAIEGSEFTVDQFSYVHDAEDYELPEGYTVGESVTGEIMIFDPKNMGCLISREFGRPVITSACGVKRLQKVNVNGD